jgi:hypothetical protein
MQDLREISRSWENASAPRVMHAPDQKLKPSMLQELKRKSSRPWKNDSLLPSSAPSARRYPPPPDDVSASSFTSALLATAPSSLAVSQEPGAEYDDASSGGFPVSRWTSSRKFRASVLMISGARTCTILILLRGGALLAMAAWESLCTEIPDDALARDGSFAACFMASPVSGFCVRTYGWLLECGQREASERGRRRRRRLRVESEGVGERFIDTPAGGLEPLDHGCSAASGSSASVVWL